MPKPIVHYEHRDRLHQHITVDSIVAFCYTGGKTIHIGRVAKLTAKRVRINYTYEYTNHEGIPTQWKSNYQAHPSNILVLNNLEQQLTVLALKGLV